jgi:endo-1,4-beta-xylanase
MKQWSVYSMARALAVVALTGIDFSAASAREAAPAKKDPLAHRKGVIVVKAPAGAEVRVEQLRHEFLFGVGASSRHLWNFKHPNAELSERFEKFSKQIAENFNLVTPGGEIKWDFVEKEHGKPQYDLMDGCVDWAEKHGLAVRGHCLFWDIPRIPPWVLKLRGKELLAAYQKRAKEVVERYKGRLIDWDFRNEILNGSHFDERNLDKGIYAKMTRWVKEADPDCNVCMNEFGVLSSEGKARAYVAAFQRIVKQGGVVDKLGCQGHYHGEDFNRGQLKRCLDIVAALKRPIIITEFNLPGQTSRYRRGNRAWPKEPLTAEQEKQKAAGTRDYLRICFEHPAVEAFVFWYPWEANTWIPQSALWKSDLTPTPALIEYRKLVFGEWWTKFAGKADAEGICRVPAFFGRHKVIVNGKERTVELKKKAGRVTVDFTQE